MANPSTREKVLKRLSRNHGMTLSRLQKRYPAVYRQVWELRVELEAAVEAAYGKIGIEQASLINMACRMEMAAKVVDFHVSRGDIEAAGVLSHVKASTEFTTKRNTAIRRLKLTGAKERDEAADDWDEVDAMMGQEAASEDEA